MARTTKTTQNAIDAYNAQIRAEHAQARAAILARRPDWNRDELAAITKLYGDYTDPGLLDILRAVETADTLNARFTK